jgi:predicted nucleic acid-binding protein
MRVYLDNCSFNRPFDPQSQLKIKLETEAKLYIQSQINNGKFELAWSYILEYENSENPYQERKETILIWKNIAVRDCDANEEIVKLAEELESNGIKAKDALHLACAIYTNCEFFITTDAKILNKSIERIKVINPIDFIKSLEGDGDED